MMSCVGRQQFELFDLYLEHLVRLRRRLLNAKATWELIYNNQFSQASRGAFLSNGMAVNVEETIYAKRYFMPQIVVEPFMGWARLWMM
jgi:hypothetical protein